MNFRFLYLVAIAAVQSLHATEPRSISGIYPSLAMFNNEGECGTGAVVPWADRLWVITYGPHLPFGSSDKLYEITPELKQIVRPESVGGTPANRMIHKETQQLVIGPYFIDAQRNVRVIPPSRMPGRLTGNARSLGDPANKIFFATMEEGLYEVDVKSLAVTSLIRDGNGVKKGFMIETPLTNLSSLLPGYHGKGLYSGQGRVVYANNGDHDKRVLTDPATPSGALGEWRKPGDDWQLVRRNQFTEVTGPGGIFGSEHPDTDPIWSIGWDAKSLILMCLDEGKWHSFRLPKVSHSYDGAHGWNTEWPRIRDIGEDDLLMTMHGAFWRFPRTFTVKNTSSIRPRGAYLKVIGDFCRWNDRLVFGCDDSAKSEFLNKRKVKGGIDGVGQSQSNLWFTSRDTPDKLGPVHAEGAVWLHDDVKAGDEAEPFLVAGWKHRRIWFINRGNKPARFLANGTLVKVIAGESANVDVETKDEWLKVKSELDSDDVSVVITLTNGDDRGTGADPIFDGIARTGDSQAQTGIFRSRGEDKRTLGFAADAGYYEMDGDFNLKRVDDSNAGQYVKSKVAIPKNVVTLDEAGALIVDDRGRRWRFPRASDAFDAATNAGALRICREVSTERDLLNVCGTFFELPAENADGFAKVRPVCSHDLRVTDYGAYRGLLLISGIKPGARADEHVIRSDDGQVALWAGAFDDLWKLGKPRGIGGPWHNTKVKAGEPSDPYLMWGYDKKSVTLSHSAKESVEMRIELDVTGTGLWCVERAIPVAPGGEIRYDFPASVWARWVRVTASVTCSATAEFNYR